MSLGKTPRHIKLDERNHAANPPGHIAPEPHGLRRALSGVGKYTHAMDGMQAESGIMGMVKKLMIIEHYALD